MLLIFCVDIFCGISIPSPEWALCALCILKVHKTTISQQYLSSVQWLLGSYTTAPLVWISLLSFFFLSLALAVFWLILWPAVIQYKIGELNLIFDPMLYVSVHFRSVNFMKTKNSCLFLRLITSVIKPLSKYFLSHSFTGKFFTWFYWRN